MKIEIETHKGQTIFYDVDSDKFVCDITIEDRFSNTKRASLKAVRQEIDKFIKLNLDFKPTKVFRKKYSGIEVKEMVGIRADGKVLIKESETYTSQASKKDLESIFVFDQSVFDEINAAEKELNEARKKCDKTIKSLESRLRPYDFSRYEHVINQIV